MNLSITGLQAFALSALASLAPSAFAQSDFSNNAVPIAGTGSFAFDITGFGPEDFQNYSNCTPHPLIYFLDGFYEWTAPVSGTYRFGVAYNSGAPGASVKLYDGFGLQAICLGSQHFLAEQDFHGLVAGDVYLVQIGQIMSAGETGEPGTLVITELPNPCAGEADDTWEDNDSCANAQDLIAPSDTISGLKTYLDDTDFWNIAIPPGHRLNMHIAGDNGFDMERYRTNCLPLGLVSSGSASHDLVYESNASNSIQNYRFEVKPRAGFSNCVTYSIDYSVEQDPCLLATQEDAFEPNDSCAIATVLDNGTYPGLFVSEYSPDTYSFFVAPGETLHVDALFSGVPGDIEIVLRRANSEYCGQGYFGQFLALGNSSQNAESLSYVNILNVDREVILEVFMPGSPGPQSRCRTYDLVISGSGDCGAGSTVCDATHTSSTYGSYLSGSFGNTQGSGLYLRALAGPPGEFGYFVVGTQTDLSASVAVGNGFLCAGGTVGRYNFGQLTNSLGLFDSQGEFENLVGTATTHGGYGFDVPNDLPLPGAPLIQLGSTYTFQLWFRDGGAGVGQSNVSSAYEVLMR